MFATSVLLVGGMFLGTCSERAYAGMGQGIDFDGIAERAQLVVDAEVTEARRSKQFPYPIDFTIRDARVLRGSLGVNTSQITFEHRNEGESGKPNYVDPGAADEALAAKSGRWIFFGFGDVKNNIPIAVHIRPGADLALVEERLGLKSADAAPSASSPVSAPGVPVEAASPLPAPTPASQPPPVLPSANRGCACAVLEALPNENAANFACALACVAGFGLRRTRRRSRVRAAPSSGASA